MVDFLYVDAASTTIDPSLDFVFTSGYYSVADGGEARYRRVPAQPAHSARFQSADGAWWELHVASPDPRQCGAQPFSGIYADQQPAIQTALQVSLDGLIRMSDFYVIGASVDLNSGQGILGASAHSSGLLTVSANAELGLSKGLITIHGDGCRVDSLTLDGRVVGPHTSLPPARSSGIHLRATSTNAVISNVVARNMTKHGFAILGTGHWLTDITGQNTIADNISCGDELEQSDATRDIRINDVTCLGSQLRGAFEINDGCQDILCDGFRMEGFFKDEVIVINDHSHKFQSNRRITVRNGWIKGSNLDRNAPGINVFASGTFVDYKNECRDILFENIVMAGCVTVIKLDLDVQRATFRNITATGVRRGVFLTGGTSLIKDIVFDNVRMEGPATPNWPSNPARGYYFSKCQNIKVNGGRVSKFHLGGVFVDTNCDDLDIDSLEVHQVNTSNADVFGIDVGAVPVSGAPGRLRITNCKIKDEDATHKLRGGIRLPSNWRDAIITGNTINGFTPGPGILVTGAIPNNHVIAQNIVVP